MMRVNNPDRVGIDPESLWMVSRTAIVEEVYFDNEQEAHEFAKSNPSFTVEAPVPQEERMRLAADKEKVSL